MPLGKLIALCAPCDLHVAVARLFITRGNEKMGKKWTGVGLALMAIMASAQFAKADDAAPVQPNSTAESRSLLDQLSDHYALTYWGNYYGPAVSGTNQLSPGPVGFPSADQYLDSVVTASYKINPNLLLGVAQEFYYRPVVGQDLTLLDPAVRLQALHVIHNDHWDLKLEGWAYGGVTAPSRADGEFSGLKFVQNLNYSNGNLTVGAYAYERQYFYDSTNPLAGTSIEDRRWYLAPNGSYAIGKNVQVTMWVDWIQSLHFRGDTGFMPTNYPWDAEPGINWDITPQLSLNPYINVYPGNPTLASTYFGMVIIGKAI